MKHKMESVTPRYSFYAKGDVCVRAMVPDRRLTILDNHMAWVRVEGVRIFFSRLSFLFLFSLSLEDDSI